MNQVSSYGLTFRLTGEYVEPISKLSFDPIYLLASYFKSTKYAGMSAV